MIGLESHFPLVSFHDPDIIVSPLHIQFSEVLGTFELIHEFWDEGKWVVVLDGPFVKFPIVLTKP